MLTEQPTELDIIQMLGEQRQQRRGGAVMALREPKPSRHRHRPTSSARCCCSTPTQELLGARDELSAARAGAARELPRARRSQRFCEWWGSEDPLALQQHYVETFDLHKRCGLYLDVLRRGRPARARVALLRLKRLYRAAGLPLEGTELPDYLPVMLEFAAAAPSGCGDDRPARAPRRARARARQPARARDPLRRRARRRLPDASARSRPPTARGRSSSPPAARRRSSSASSRSRHPR